jgi:SAM-dependent methyltransferase
LLGVTPALASLGTSLLAVEAIPSVISALWIGDGPDRSAQVGDWRNLPCADKSRTAVIGDGVFSAADADPAILMAEFIRVLDPAGIIAIRCFCAPARPEPFDAIVSDTLAGKIADLNVLKWRIAMRLSANNIDHRVPVSCVLEKFDILFPDRRLLMDRTGWLKDQFDFIDLYKGASSALRFLPEDRLIASFSTLADDISFLRPQGYPMAAQSPILLLRGPRQC